MFLAPRFASYQTEDHFISTKLKFFSMCFSSFYDYINIDVGFTKIKRLLLGTDFCIFCGTRNTDHETRWDTVR